MDPAQIVIFVIIIVLTIAFLFLGREFFFVLRELRQTLIKTNRILDTAEKISENISNPINTLSSVVTGAKAGGLIASIIKKIKQKERDE